MNSRKPGKAPTTYTPSYKQQTMLEMLAALRADAGYTQRKADLALGWGQGTVARYELAEKRVPPEDLDKMLDLFGADAATRKDLRARLAVNLEDAFWERYEFVNAAYSRLMINESAAEAIVTSDGTSMPGLLQTFDYGMEVASKTASTRNQDKWIEYCQVRQRRQKVLEKWIHAKPPTRMPYTAYLAEYLLTWGRPEVMAGQLAHLLEVGAQENVTIRVIPKESGIPVYPYVLMDLPDERQLAATALPNSTMFLDEDQQLNGVKEWLGIYDHLALSEADSRKVVTEKMMGFQ